MDIKKIRESYSRDIDRTHYPDCEYLHPLCAIEMLCSEVEQLEKELEDKECAVKHLLLVIGTLKDKDYGKELVSHHANYGK